jgi:flavorubredoxin
MKALIVYASWFGHNRTIARALGDELRRRGVTVVCAPISRISTSDVIGYEIVVFGTYTHSHHASSPLRRLCESIPLRRLSRMSLGVFAALRRDGRPDGADELAATIEGRAVELAAPPLHLALTAPDYLPWSRLDPEARRAVAAGAEQLVEAAVPERLVA